MRKRCLNPKHEKFKFYGGRGIVICDRWNDFAAFLADMGERPAGMTLDRKDNDGNYEPGNCKWSTQAEQRRNGKRVVNITHNGETRCISDWAASVGMSRRALLKRHVAGWDFARALSTPVAARRLVVRDSSAEAIPAESAASTAA